MPHIENRWTWQGVSTLALLVGLILAAGAWRGNHDANASRIPLIEQHQQDHGKRITALETSVRYTDQRYSEILARLERIDRKLDEKADKQR